MQLISNIPRSNVLYLWFSECRNRHDDAKCDEWAALGRCIGNTYESMNIQCKRSCGFCSKYNITNVIKNLVSIFNTLSSCNFQIFSFISSLVAHDLFQEIPKTTCFPERNERYEMITAAKFACANDPSCSGLVESPKRRGQQVRFGNYSLTEREYLICDYPVSTKRTDDTLFFLKRGKSKILYVKKV